MPSPISMYLIVIFRLIQASLMPVYKGDWCMRLNGLTYECIKSYVQSYINEYFCDSTAQSHASEWEKSPQKSSWKRAFKRTFFFFSFFLNILNWKVLSVCEHSSGESLSNSEQSHALGKLFPAMSWGRPCIC